MKRFILNLNMLAVMILSCMTLMSCQKDDTSDEPQLPASDLIVGTWTATGTATDGTPISSEMTFKVDKSFALITNGKSGKTVETGVYRLADDNMYLTFANGSNRGKEIGMKYELKDNQLTIHNNNQDVVIPNNYTRKSGSENPGQQTGNIVGTWTASGKTLDGDQISLELTLRADKSFALFTTEESKKTVETGVYRLTDQYIYLTYATGSNAGQELALKYELKGNQLTIYENYDGESVTTHFTRKNDSGNPGQDASGLIGTWAAGPLYMDGYNTSFEITFNANDTYSFIRVEDSYKTVELGVYRVSGNYIIITPTTGSNVGEETKMKYELNGNKLTLHQNDEGEIITVVLTRTK